MDEVLLSVSDYGAELDARGDGEALSYAEKMRGALERLSVALDDFEPPERERDDDSTPPTTDDRRVHSFIHSFIRRRRRKRTVVSFVSFFLYSNIHHIITPHARVFDRSIA